LFLKEVVVQAARLPLPSTTLQASRLCYANWFGAIVILKWEYNKP